MAAPDFSNSHFTCTAEDPRKIRGRSAEDIRGSHALGAPPSRKPSKHRKAVFKNEICVGSHSYVHISCNGFLNQDRFKIGCCGAPGGHHGGGPPWWTPRWPPNHQKSVSSRPRKIRGRSAEDLRKTTAEVIFMKRAPVRYFFNPPYYIYIYCTRKDAC